MLIQLSHLDIVSGEIDVWQMQDYKLTLYKSDNLAGVVSSQIAPDFEDGNLSAHIELEIDVTTDTDEHRLSLIASASSSLPANDLVAVALIRYVQNKIG